jgi:hypothetical protein
VQRIWYVAYGSNLSRERFCHYLRGGRPNGVERDYPGCRDTSDELDSFGLLITGSVYLRRLVHGLARWDGILRSGSPG